MVVGILAGSHMHPLCADNDNVDPDEPLRLADAVKFGFRHGGMTVSGLKREARAGRLVPNIAQLAVDVAELCIDRDHVLAVVSAHWLEGSGIEARLRLTAT